MQATSLAARRVLLYETESLLHRLNRVRPLVTQIPAVPAAAIGPEAASAIDRFLAEGREQLRSLVHEFQAWLRHAGEADPADAQRRFSLVRLHFNRVLAQFETFSDALLQRCEHDYGMLLRGMDILAGDALALGAAYFAPCPVITYLDRGFGAAIRRARTRLPGGGRTPVAIIRVPRERMVGSGIGASLIHEVGHQVAALLDIVRPLRLRLRSLGTRTNASHWTVWERWISEIVADFWAVGVLGIGGTIGLMQVVSLPRPFVFRMHPEDVHPVPWIRVHLSCAMGKELYPHPQWARLRCLWDEMYPLDSAEPAAELMREVDAHVPALVAVLLNFRPAACGGKRLCDLAPTAERTPAQLAVLHQDWRLRPHAMYQAAPSLAMAVLGQAKFDGSLPAEEESTLHSRLLQSWAMRETIGMPAFTQVPSRAVPLRRAA
jgi:hypothetical protein